MPAGTRPDPKYRRHKPSGQAVVTLSGKDCYLGRYDSPESHEKYRRLIAEWKANGRQLHPQQAELTILGLIAAFWTHAEQYYVRPDGTTDSELKKYRLVLRVLKELYGSEPAAGFSPKRLKACRERMVEMGWCRKYINRQITRLKGVFSWGVEEELIPPAVYQALQAVKGLRSGKTVAPEAPPVKPVPEPHITALKPHLSRQVWAMIQLQVLTGARPGEVVNMRPVDLETSGEVWTYSPLTHKTDHHGHQRLICIGPQAQQVLLPFLGGRRTDAFIFSPLEAEAERHAAQRANRKSKPTPSQRARTNATAGRERRRSPGPAYDVASYRRAIARACRAADARAHQCDPSVPLDQVLVPVWHPHQLRHNAATSIRRAFDIETARVVLGHRSAAVTQIYAEQDLARAREAMRKLG